MVHRSGFSSSCRRSMAGSRRTLRRPLGLAAAALVLCTHTAAGDTVGLARPRPEYRWGVDGPILGASAVVWLVGVGLHTDEQTVPASGLDPSTITEVKP